MAVSHHRFTSSKLPNKLFALRKRAQTLQRIGKIKTLLRARLIRSILFPVLKIKSHSRQKTRMALKSVTPTGFKPVTVRAEI